MQNLIFSFFGKPNMQLRLHCFCFFECIFFLSQSVSENKRGVRLNLKTNRIRSLLILLLSVASTSRRK